MFSIPWKHAARHGWELDKDACLFKKWAIHTGAQLRMHVQNAENKTFPLFLCMHLSEKHTKLNWIYSAGKYVEGQTCDPKTWKANFRCAMNSLPDIEEVKDKSVNKGHQAMRVFRMLPASPKSRGEKTGRKWASILVWSGVHRSLTLKSC